MHGWASSGRIKIDRANEHIRHLDADISAYLNRRPYVVVPDTDSEGEIPGAVRLGHLFYVREREALNPQWACVVADAIHNLHVALDYLWQRATTTNGHRKNYFPAYPDPESAKPLAKRKKRGRTHPAVELLGSLNAFEVGNAFWRIREFDDTDKHDTITLVACYPGTISVDTSRMGRSASQEVWLYGQRDPDRRPRPKFPVLEDGATLYTHPFDPEMDVDVYLDPLILFGEGGLMEGRVVVPTLQNLSAAVEGLAAAFVEAGLLH